MPKLVEKRRRLFELAATQGGYFTAAQARALGYSSRSLVHHAGAGHFERVSRGFYRLADLPALSHEDVIAAWVKAGRDRAVVSHETALTLYELAPIRPRKIHLTVSRAHRPHSDRPQLAGVQIHTITRRFHPDEVVQRFGVQLTSVARTIVDAADSGTDPSFIIEAIEHALHAGMVVADELRQAGRDRSERVRKLIDGAIEATQHAAVR